MNNYCFSNRYTLQIIGNIGTASIIEFKQPAQTNPKSPNMTSEVTHDLAHNEPLGPQQSIEMGQPNKALEVPVIDNNKVRGKHTLIQHIVRIQILTNKSLFLSSLPRPKNPKENNTFLRSTKRYQRKKIDVNRHAFWLE